MGLFDHKWKKYISATLIFALVMVISLSVLNAEDELIKWKQKDTMDLNFNVIENKAGDNEVLLEMDIEDPGVYTLQYYLEDGRQNEIKINQTYDEIVVEYFVWEKTETAPGSGTYTTENITQELINKSYLEMDYTLSVPDWEFDDEREVTTSGALELKIERSASSAYPGVAFEVDNKRVLIKWDFQQNLLYALIGDYENGKIMPVSFETPDKGTEGFKVLKQLEDFDVKPTHLKPNAAGTDDIELVPIVLPNNVSDRPGNRPGLKITFKQPKELNAASWIYDSEPTNLEEITAIFELEDIESGDYHDFKFRLQDEGDQSIIALPSEDADVNTGVEYIYDPATYEYEINMVSDKSDLVNKDTIIQWSDLKASSLYNVYMSFQYDLDATSLDDLKVSSTYLPEDNFAYTYMEYDLKRSSVEEAYLDIEPYRAGEQQEVEYIILYSKTIKSTLDSDEDLWLKNYHTSTGAEDEQIFIPIPFKSTSSQDAYQVIINFAGTEIYSQVLNYEANKDTNVPPTTPGIETIENLFVVPPQSSSEEDPRKIMFDFEWDAPTNKAVKELDVIFEDGDDDPSNDKLYYEISVNEVPTNEGDNPFSVLKVFEVYKDGEVYKLKSHDDSPYIRVDGSDLSSDPKSSIPSEFVNYDFGYNDIDELFRMEKVTFYDEVLYEDTDGWASVLNTTIDDVANTYSVSSTDEAYDFEFPGVNYIRVRAITIKDGELASSQLSIPASLALNLISYDIPIVDDITYSPIYGTESNRDSGVSVEWHTVENANYDNNMLAPIDYDLENIVYSVYIAQEKATLLPLDEDDNNHTLTSMESDSLVVLSEDEVEKLREGEIVYFNVPTSTVLNKDLSVDIEGLDVNRNYYIRIVTKFVIDDTDLDDPDLPLETRRSDASSVLGVTVPKTPGEPSDEEIVPLAPEYLEVEFSDDSQVNAGLTWQLPTEMTFDSNANAFEIFAIEDRSLPSDLTGKNIDLEDLLRNEDLEEDVIEGWRLIVVDGVTHLKKYDLATHEWEDKELELVTINKDTFYVIDDSNAPNKVNYYYVRTIKVDGEKVKARSPWVSDSLTTAPVKGPVNLIVDYDSPYDYEPKEAFIIRFDAPISEVDDIGIDYLIEVHVKGENDTDYSTITYPAELVGSEEDGPIGYERLYYRITDLKPGKTYSIKIRIEDRTKAKEILPNGESAYPKSPFSDRVVSRTEFDQESYEKENKYVEYIEYYVDKAEELKELLYFDIKQTDDESAIKYRANYSEGVIKRNTNSEWYLESKDATTNTYYIPAESIEAINDSGVTIVVESKDQVVGIRPDTVGPRLTSEIADLLEDIARYASPYEDYYLRIRVFTDTYNGKVNNLEPNSELVQVEFGLVESEKQEEQLDEMMVATLDKVIDSKKKDLIKRLEEELEQGINDDRLLKIVEEVVDMVRDDYMIHASTLFKGYTNGDVRIIKELDQAVYIGLEPTNSPANNSVYTKRNGIWKKVESDYFNSKHYVEANYMDPFLLVPSLSADEDLVEVYSQQGVDIINTYTLSTIFSADELDEPNTEVKKYQWHSALARLAGASAGEDTADYLSSRGIDASSNREFYPTSYEEALSLYIDTYAYRHLIDLSHVNIVNYNLVEDLEQVEEAYRTKMTQGANLGIVPTENGRIDPKHPLSVEEAIELLILLHNGLD